MKMGGLNMGSRIMHLIVGNEVSKRLNIKNRNLFLLGSVAADATSDKIKTHFFKGNLELFTRHVDYEAFISKYKNIQDNDFILGYYSHLITDDFWMSGFYVPWLRNRIEKTPDIQALYYNDFYLLNSKLLDYYKPQKEIQNLFDIPERLDFVEEVLVEDIIKFLEYIRDDLDYTKEELNEPLNVFTLPQIVGYLETSIEKSIYKIKQLQKENM